MKLNLAVTARLLFVSATWATLPFAAPLHGASPGFPFAEDFQSPSLLDSTQTTARRTSSGVTLGRARHLHMRSRDFAPRHSDIGNSPATAAINDIAVHDMDGDGNMDVITAGAGGVFVYYIDKGADLESVEPVRIASASSFRAMAIGDFDRDGYLDVAAASNLREVVPFMNNKGARDVFIERRQVSDLRVMALASADMDGDGDLDLVLAQSKGRIVEVHLNDGAGNFSENEDAVSFVAGHNGGLGVGDFNGDGDMDIALAKVGGMNMFYLNDGSGGFPDRQLLNHTGTATFYRGLALGDVNNDGHLDIVVGVRTAQNLLYLGDGNGGFSTGSRINNSVAWTIDVELADLDGDGDLDLFEGVSRRGHRVYLNQDGVLDSEGLPVRGRTNAIAVGDADGDGHLGMVHGRNPAELKVARFSERQMSAPSTSLFDTGRGRVVSGKVNGDEGVPHIVFLTATAVQQEHTDIEYYLSNNDGKHWIRAYPGRVARFSSAGNVLRWRAELKSRSPVKTTTLTRVSIESVLQVFIDGEVFSNGQAYTETTHTITAEFKATTATIRLMNRGEQVLTVTGVATVGQVFGLEDGRGESLAHPLAESIEIEEGGNGGDIRLVFNPMVRGIHASTLTISGSEGGRVLPDIKVALSGQGIGAEINVPKSINPIRTAVGTSDRQTVRITNKGETPLTITSATVPDSVFSLVEPALPTTLTAGRARDFKFRFKPKAPGTIATTITFISNAFNGAVTRTLAGKGLAPVIEIPPPALVSVREGGRTTGVLAIRNTGDSDMTVTAVTGTDDFFKLVSPTTASINESGLMVAKGTTEMVVFSFTPKRNMRSAPTANIIFTSDAFNDTQTEVMLRGIGTAPEIDFEPTVNFGGVRVGESDTRTVVIENTGDAPLIVSGVISKTTAADVRGLFAWVPPFPEAASQTVAAEATATLTLRFTPRIRRDAPFTDTLMIDSDAVNMTDKFLTVMGEGIAPVMAIAITGTGLIKPDGSTASVALHDFGDVPIRTRTSREVYISNDGTAPLEVAVSLIGGRGFRWDSTPDGVITVEDGFSAADLEPSPNLVVHFRPQDREPDTARLIFRDTRNNLHTTYTLTGRGTGAEMQLRMGDEALAEGTTHTFSATKVNTSRTVTVELHNRGNVPMNISTPTLAKRGDLTGFSLVESGGLPDTVPEEGFERFTFRFKPTARGTATALVTFTSDAANATRTTIFLQGRGTAPGISVTPTGTIQFGDVRARTSTDRHVKITNTGDATLEVTSVRVVNDDGTDHLLFSVVSPRQFPHSVGVGDDLPVTLSFMPLEPMETDDVGRVVIGSDAFNTLEKSPTVSGRGVASMMAIVITDTGTRMVPVDTDSTLLYDFGDVPINTSASRRVVISNQRGTAPLRVEIPLPGEAEPFQWRNDPVPGVAVAEFGKSTSGLILVFEPREIGPSSTTLTFRSNAFENADQTVTLMGRGTGAEMELRVGNKRLVPGVPHTISATRVNASTMVAVEVHNRGNVPMNISRPTTEDKGDIAGFSLVETGNLPSVVTDGQSVTFRFQFSPNERGTAMTDITFASNAASSGTQTITLQGEAVAPVMVVQVDGKTRESDSTFDMRVFLSGWGPYFTQSDFVVGNQGNADLIVSSISPLGRESGYYFNSNPFSPSSGGITIHENSSHTWTLFFFPGDIATTFSEVIRIVSNDEASPFELNVRGIAVGSYLDHSFEGCDAEYNTPYSKICAIDNVRLGTTASVGLVMRNGGNELLTGTVEMEHDNPAYRIYDINDSEFFSINLKPNEIITQTITFSPSDANAWQESYSYSHRLQIRIRTNGIGGTQDELIEVWGRVVGPEMHVDIGEPVPTYTESTETQKQEYAFGHIMVNTSKTVPLTIRNLGNRVLTATVSVSNDAYRLFNKDGSSAENRIITIGAGLNKVLDLRFTPSVAPTTYQETLTIISNDYDEGTYMMTLTGWSVAEPPKIVVMAGGTTLTSGTTLDFRLPDNAQVTTDIVVWNRGTADLVVNPIGLVTGSSAVEAIGRYRLSGGQTRTIPKNSSHTWALHFRPPNTAVAVTHTEEIRILSNGGTSPFILNVQGIGVAAPVSAQELPITGFTLALRCPNLNRSERSCHTLHDVHRGETLNIDFAIRNYGNKRFEGRVKLGAMNIPARTGRRGNGNFFRISGSGTLTLPPGESTSLRILFTVGEVLVRTEDIPIVRGRNIYVPRLRAPLIDMYAVSTSLIFEGNNPAESNSVSLWSRFVPWERSPSWTHSWSPFSIWRNAWTTYYWWLGGAQRPAIPTFTALEPDTSAPRFVGLGYADEQRRLWLAFDEPVQILSGTNSSALADGAVLPGFEVLPNYTGGDGVEDIGVLRARYRSGGVVMDLARGIVPADALIWARYTPPSDGVSGIYDMASPPNRISLARLFMLPRSAVLDYDGDGFPDALEARLGGNPLVADDVAGLPEVALLRAGVAGSPAAVAYSGIRADGVAAHLGVVTTGASSLAAYYLSDTFGYSGGYALGVGSYGCTGRFPADYASPLFGGGCAVVDFNNIRAGVEHRIGWFATNAAGYWAVAEGTASRLPEQVILRVPEFNMKRRNVFVANSAAADEMVRVGAFHDGPASSQSLTVSLSNVVAADSPSSSQPDGFSVPVAGVTTDMTSYAITGVHSGEDSKLWLAGDPLSSLTPDKYSLGKVTQTDVVRLADDNLPPLFGRASLYAVSTASANERHAVVVRGTENYIALLPVVHGTVQTATAFEVSPWDSAGGGEPVAADDKILAVNTASPVADGALVKIAFTASNPPETVRNTVSLEVAASSAGASTATTMLTWPVIDSADALASIAGDIDNDGIPDVRDSYRLLNRLPISVAGGVSGYPDRSSAGAGSWHHIRPLLPLHNQFVGSYATRAGLSFHTDFAGDARILARLPVVTSDGQTITAPEGQSVLAATYQPGVPVQMNYADFAASLSRDEFDAMVEQSRRDIAVVYNFRLHGVEPSVAQAAQGATLSGGRAGVVIPLPESLHEQTNILPLHYTGGAWSGFSTESDTPGAAGFAPLQAGVCPDDSGIAGSPYRTAGALNTRKRTGDACMVLYLTDGAAADRDGNTNGVVDALIGLAAIVPPR